MSTCESFVNLLIHSFIMHDSVMVTGPSVFCYYYVTTALSLVNAWVSGTPPSLPFSLLNGEWMVEEELLLSNCDRNLIGFVQDFLTRAEYGIEINSLAFLIKTFLFNNLLNTLFV